MRGGGGVFITVREGVVAEHLTEFDTNCEISWIKIQLQKKNYMIIVILSSFSSVCAMMDWKSVKLLFSSSSTNILSFSQKLSSGQFQLDSTKPYKQLRL